MGTPLIRDDSQQNAELRQAFINHLPRRIELVQKRVARFSKGAFDVNTLSVLLGEVQSLAGASGRYGLMGPSERLYALEQRLEAMLSAARELEPEERAELDALSLALSRASQAEVKVRVSISDLSPDLMRLDGRHFYLAAPPEYWRRFSAFEIAPISSDDAIASTQAPTRASAAAVVSSSDDIIVDDMDIDANSPNADMPTLDMLDARVNLTVRADRDVFGALVEESHKLPTLDEDELEFIETKIDVRLPHVEPAADSAMDYQFAADEVEVDVPAPLLAPMVEAPPRAQFVATKRVFYLAPEHEYFHDLAAMLAATSLDVDRIESMDELVETLSSMTADLVLIDSMFAPQLEPVGDFFKALKLRTNTKMPVVCFADANDLSARIRAMRAGVDLLIPTKTTAADAFVKLQEQLEQEQKLDFRIMIVEDDRSQALFAESVLRKTGMETLAVTDPLKTLDALERFKPDLILMDLYMPGIDGMELTAIIREREEFITTPIVFLSGEQDSEKQFDALSAGGDDFLSKPIRPKNLISAVTNRARRARAMNAKRRTRVRDTDSGLFDRSVVLDRLSSALIVEDRNQLKGGIVFLELDDSKALREATGLAGLDAVCNLLGARMKSLLHVNESAARFGDASILIISQERSIEELMNFAQSCVELAGQPFEVDDKLLPASLCAGVARFAESLADAAGMINAAEAALKTARANFANSKSKTDRVARFEIAARELSADEMLLESIKIALSTDGFQLLFQPIVAMDNNADEQYEVLLRLRTPNGQVYGAAQVFECADQHQLTADIDRWMLSRCFTVIDERKRQGRAPVRLSVNQSAASLRDANRIAWLRQTIETRRVDPASLCLEFVMADIMQELRAAVPFFQSAKQLGLQLTLENFESSLTALQMLSYLPVDNIKISSKYIDSSGATREELKALIRAAHDGKRKVTAAKVETAQMASALWQIGVDFLQGNFVQQPGAELGFDFRGANH
jgi:EAL domain-containing protein (putative c-di-GMP-specific phosphodiesterase class I)/PleD family two-component response regulator